MKILIKSHNNFPRGATSLLVVTGLALVLIVIITGLSTLSIRQSQQALNTDLSNRALAAAESAAQDAAQRLRSNPEEEYPSCSDITQSSFAGDTTSFNNAVKPLLSAVADNKTSVVCRTVSSSGTLIDGKITKDSDTQINLSIDTVKTIGILWNKTVADGTPAEWAGSSVYPTLAGYSGPAALELTIIYWPKDLNNAFLNAQESSGLRTKTRLVLPGREDFSPIQGVSRLTSGCGASVEYTCNANIDIEKVFGVNPVQNNMVFRIKPRYKDTHFSARFFKNTDVNIFDSPTARVKNSKAVIDVTAKVGDLYRRVKAELPIQNLSWLDAVLYSNSGICKNLRVYDNHSADSAIKDGRNDCGNYPND